MNEIVIRDDETLEDLQTGGLKLIQKKKGFRFGMDSVLLADFASIRAGDQVADFGTGTGILLLLLYARGKGKKLWGLEIQTEMAEMALRTIRLNKLEDAIKIVCTDIAESGRFFAPSSMDAIVCNPPYGMPGKAVRNLSETIATARHQDYDTLDVFFSAAFRMLKGKGRIFIIYPAPQLFSLMTALKRNHLEPKKFRLVYPDLSKGANLILLEAVKDGRPLLQPLPPLIIYDKDRKLTEEMRSIYYHDRQARGGINFSEQAEKPHGIACKENDQRI